MLNCNMTDNNIGNYEILKNIQGFYSQSQISTDNNSLLELEVLPISENVDTQVSSENSSSFQSSDLDGIKNTKESFSSQNNSDFKRKTVISKAERRAEHNAIERARRECLNSKFQQLAEILPNLHHHRRPSKGQIVEKALDWVTQNVSKEDRYQYQIIQLQNENKRLIDQITLLQKKVNIDTVTPPSPVSPIYPVYSHQLLPTIYQTGEPLCSKENYHFYPSGDHVNQLTRSEYRVPQNIQAGFSQYRQYGANDDDNDSNSSDENTCDKNNTINQSLNRNMLNNNYVTLGNPIQTHQQYSQCQTEPIYLHSTYTI